MIQVLAVVALAFRVAPWGPHSGLLSAGLWVKQTYHTLCSDSAWSDNSTARDTLDDCVLQATDSNLPCW